MRATQNPTRASTSSRASRSGHLSDTRPAKHGGSRNAERGRAALALLLSLALVPTVALLTLLALEWVR